jgi:hypothetical protein
MNKSDNIGELPQASDQAEARYQQTVRARRWWHAAGGAGRTPPGRGRGRRGIAGECWNAGGRQDVRGIHCALQGRLGQDVEIRT